jgi:thiol-disulfide isomerase/thioredoxin
LNTKSYFLIILSFILLSITNCDNKTGQVQYSKTFTLHTLDNKELVIVLKDPHKIEVKTKEFQNKTILFDFWTTWCPSCVKEIPHLNSLAKKYKGSLEIIGVVSEENKDNKELKKFLETNPIKYTIATTNKDNINIKLFEELTNSRTLPFKAMYDKNGDYITHYYGAIPEEMLDIDIHKSLNKR